MFSLKQYPLSFRPGALAPYMSADTIRLHHGKHLDGYINNLNKLIAGTDYEDMELVEIINKSVLEPESAKIFNNAAQVFNHDFFFHCLAKNKKASFPDQLIEVFGSQENFAEEFKIAALSVFGSGWVWLVKDDGVLRIITTANADTPVAHDMIPILTLDVWEHAYYLDYQNRRGDFIDAFLEHLVDWDWVSENL